MRRSTFALALALVASLVFFLGESIAHAQSAQKPRSQSTGYSRYEKETIERTLNSLGLELDPAPDGKTIERIDTVRLEVLEARDPGPELLKPVPLLSPLSNVDKPLLNKLHYVTRDYVVRREMLLNVGDVYEQVIIDEVARNMRSRMPLQVSIVILVPIKSSTAGKVGVLVITKDIWSLRLSYDMSVTPGGVESLVIVPQETNVLGYHHAASTRFLYAPETLTFGAGYKVPRFGYSWLGASLAASITVNRNSGAPEGSGATLSFGQDLYSTRTEWAYGLDASYNVGIARRYVNARVGTFDSRLTPTVRDNIPNQYRSGTTSAKASITRSFGWALKNNFTFSFTAVRSSYDPIDLGRFDPNAARDFVERFVPVGETRVYPSLAWSTFTTNFMRTLDVNTLALQEDFRLGHDVSVVVYPVSKALGSTRDFIGVAAKAGYAIAIKDGLIGAKFGTVAENQDGIITDGSVEGSFGIATPRLGFGRLVMNMAFLNRYRNYLRARTFTGGDDRLRGYPSNYFFGKDAIFYNLEFRSTSIEIMKIQIGGVAFFDAGDVAQAFDILRAKQSLGVGLRTLIPQLNRLVFRADLAFPLKRGPFPETGIPTPVSPVGFFITFDQAFSP